jgi:outer membrane cobalamin receptor
VNSKERLTLKKILLYIAVIISFPLHGQINLNNDTVKIQEVVIARKKSGTDHAGYKNTSIDSSALKSYSNSSLSELLSLNSNIVIKSYGMGGVATPTFRGTGASHTQLDWNGINLNSPMLGQSDLSIVPSGLIDDIQIYYGGASMSVNSGGIGGIINIETKPVWKKETSLLIDPGVGSFGRFSGLIKVKSGNINFQTITKAFFQSAENNFRYLNSVISAEPFRETRRNSQLQQHGLMQEFYFRKADNVVSARIWYQAADRNLPASLLTQPVNTGEKQQDESLRTMLNFSTYRGRNNYSLTGVWMFSNLHYTNRLAEIDSRNLAQTLILKSEMERRIGENTKLKIVMNDELSFINSNNYNHNVSRNTAILTLSAEHKGFGKFDTFVLLREILDKNSMLIPDFSAGLQFRLIEEKDYFLKGNISRNSKIPTMNDLFWMPGGNPDLKNEYAYMYELTYEMSQKSSQALSFKYDVSVFHNRIKDMIQWHPGEFSIWTADNIQSVNTLGLESSFRLEYTYHNLISRINASYTYTRAANGSSNTGDNTLKGKQLMYIPENQANASYNLNYKMYYFSWLANLTGRRFITVDNSGFLPGYFLNDIHAGLKLKLKSNFLDMSFNIDNVFNVDYQTIAYFPLPGRSYFVKLLFQLVK